MKDFVSEIDNIAIKNEWMKNITVQSTSRLFKYYKNANLLILTINIYSRIVGKFFT